MREKVISAEDLDNAVSQVAGTTQHTLGEIGKLMEVAKENAQLKADNATLREKNKHLLASVVSLEAQLESALKAESQPATADNPKFQEPIRLADEDRYQRQERTPESRRR